MLNKAVQLFVISSIFVFFLIMLKCKLSDIVDRYKCKSKTKAILFDKSTTSHGYNTYVRTLIFEYTFNGKYFQRVTSLDIPKKKLYNSLIIGEEYEVMIDENNPKHVKLTNRIIYTEEIVEILIYLFMTGVSFFGSCAAIINLIEILNV